MSPGRFQAGATHILYDPRWTASVSLEWLHPEFWRLRGAVLRDLGGRGQAIVVETDAGRAVLRRYHRGGQAARVSRDRYLFSGYSRSRGFREWQVLQQLHARGLPAPRPLMVSCERCGPSYRAGLLTALIPKARTLLDAVDELNDDDWRTLVETLRRFFAAGVVHADLNASNVLRSGNRGWHLIDFDRARIRPAPVDPKPMIRRLQRSLIKHGKIEAAERLARDFVLGR